LTSKVPQSPDVLVHKDLATTVGERAANVHDVKLATPSALIFLAFFGDLASGRFEKYHPFAYWAVVVATPPSGTTMSTMDRTLAPACQVSIPVAVPVVLSSGSACWSIIENITQELKFYG